MFCVNCGAEAANSAVFCTKCGTNLVQNPVDTTMPHSPGPAAIHSLPAAAMQIPLGGALAKIAAGFYSIRIILLVVAVVGVATAGVVYFTAPSPSQTVRNFATDVNSHEWNKVAGYASSDTCKYVEKQRDMAVAMMKLATSLTGFLNGALPSILENALGVMGASPDRLQKMNGRELFAGLLKVYESVQKANGSTIPRLDVEVLSEKISGNHAVVRMRDKNTGEEADLKMVRDLMYWKIDFVDPNTPVFPLEKMLQNAGLGH